MQVEDVSFMKLDVLDRVLDKQLIFTGSLQFRKLILHLQYGMVAARMIQQPCKEMCLELVTLLRVVMPNVQ